MSRTHHRIAEGSTEHDKQVADDTKDTEIGKLTREWKRALADAETARKRADTARAEGCEHGIAVAVEALAPALDALSFAIEAARKTPDSNDPDAFAHLESLEKIRTAFETGLKALGVRSIAPENVPFDPGTHEASDVRETKDIAPGQVVVLHRPGLAIGQRLIRPAHVTVSAAPSETSHRRS